MAQFEIPDRDKTGEMRYQMGYALADLAQEYPKIVALDADLRSSTGLHIFEHFHPDKLIKCGIAEQNMISMAAGMSQEGYIPFPCTFDAFSRRFMDQLYISVCYGNISFLRQNWGNEIPDGLCSGRSSPGISEDRRTGRRSSKLHRTSHLRALSPG